MNNVRHKWLEIVANFHFASHEAHPLGAIFWGLWAIFKFILAFGKPIGNALRDKFNIYANEKCRMGVLVIGVGDGKMANLY